MSDADRLRNRIIDILKDDCYVNNESVADAILFAVENPPPPSLRDDIERLVTDMTIDEDAMTDAVLAVVRRHVEAQQAWTSDRWIKRDDVLRLLGGTGE